MDKKAVLEKVAIVFGIGIILTALWFYNMQLDDTLATLRMAYPD